MNSETITYHKELPWTESGRELLLKFNMLISQYGGKELLAIKIESESREFFGLPKMQGGQFRTGPLLNKNSNPYTYADDEFIKKHWKTHTLTFIGKKLNKCPTAISNRGRIIGFPFKPDLRKGETL